MLDPAREPAKPIRQLLIPGRAGRRRRPVVHPVADEILRLCLERIEHTAPFELARDPVRDVGLDQLPELREHVVGFGEFPLHPDEQRIRQHPGIAETGDPRRRLGRPWHTRRHRFVNPAVGGIKERPVLRNLGGLHPGRRVLFPAIAKAVGFLERGRDLVLPALEFVGDEVVAIDEDED